MALLRGGCKNGAVHEDAVAHHHHHLLWIKGCCAQENSRGIQVTGFKNPASCISCLLPCANDGISVKRVLATLSYCCRISHLSMDLICGTMRSRSHYSSPPLAQLRLLSCERGSTRSSPRRGRFLRIWQSNEKGSLSTFNPGNSLHHEF